MTGRHARHLVVAVVVFSLVALRAPVYAQQPPLDDLRTRADQGEAEAQFILGTMYESGTVLVQNYVEAARWHRRAAEQGYALSFLTLGRAYFSARGVPQDFVSAHMWFNLAAAYLSGEERDTAIAQRDLVDAEMTSDQRAEAQRLAREWQPRSERPNGVSTQQGDRSRSSRGGRTVGTPGIVAEAPARDRFSRDVTTADRRQISVGFGVGRSSGLNSLGVGFGWFLTQMYARFWNDLADHASASR